VAVLSESDYRLIREWREFGVLQDVDDHRLDQREGVILITCSDGDRFCDIFAKQVRMVEGQCKDPRIHTFAWNGGILRIAPGSPANKPGRTTDEDLLDEVADARAMKGINLVAGYSHIPCGKAGACKISPEQVIRLHIAAKRRIKELNRGIKVANFCHIDYGNGSKRTYFLSRCSWEEWVRRRAA
jgi:hypothetical protein